MSGLPLGIAHFFAFVQRVFLGKGFSFVTCYQCETRGFTLPFWEGVAPSHVAQRYTSRLLHRFRTCAQKSSSNLLHRCCLVFLWTTARGGRDTPFGCAVHPARVVSMMRLQACQCQPHELLLLVLRISVSSRTTFPLPRNVLLRPCLRCTSSSAHTSTISSDCLLSLSLTQNRSALELHQNTGHILLSSTHARFWYPFSSLCCRFSANLPKTHALMRCRLATSFTFFTT